MIDLRSDTVTRPTSAMKDAMMAAPVGKATELAREHGLSTHLDGARLFNAVVASDTPLRQPIWYSSAFSK